MTEKNDAVELFVRLATIDSESFEEKAVSDYIKEFLSQLNITATVDDVNLLIGGQTGNLRFDFPARKGFEEVPKICFCAHMDTVKPGKSVKPIVESERITSDGSTILGADCKVGCAAILYLAMRLSNDLSHGDVSLLFTVAEEKGLAGSQNMGKGMLDFDYCYVIDNCGTPGTFITRAPFQDRIEMIFNGRLAHAGVEPEKGINSIVMASNAISLMNTGRIDAESTSNIGIIRGGEATNIVPEITVVEAEARSLSREKMIEIEETMFGIARESAESMGGTVDIKTTRLYDGYEIPDDSRIIEIAKRACKNAGLLFRKDFSCGGSDANAFNAKGALSVVMNAGFYDCHTKNEYVDIKEYVQLIELITAIVNEAKNFKRDNSR